ncbi:hypothetical protein FHY13_003108 [Xanthomonas arboricola]|uniref:hypothetical protein n=1 Tax=Xanthomonas euroxanthea TaxID=2259622 RepID=UPI001620675A|nr:hypothetical protein [Xanthomonas euroxanthea]MBB3814737.1 hypothetical protein [Xanthomonas euroxanthea]
MEDKILNSITPPPSEGAIQSNYCAFNEVCEKELKVVWRAENFANRDLYFYRVDTDAKWESTEGEISLFEPPSVQLGKLKDKFGIYHIWVDHGATFTQEDHIFQAVYVGKGYLNIRLNKHVSKYLNELGTVFITVQECENRMAKYLEQLFLDTFNFPLNIAENTGAEGYLYTRAKWKSATTGSDGDEKALRHAHKLENDRRE